jgi:diguanylate cyclase
MDFWPWHLPIPLMLAVFATLGYLLGLRNRTTGSGPTMQARREVRRAHLVAKELEKIAWGIRKSLASHHASVTRFKEQMRKLSEDEQEAAWKQLCLEAEQILKPTLRLANEIANAYDLIRQQTANLMSFTEARTDPLTGLSNRRAFDDALVAQFAMMSRYDTRFSLTILDIDNFKKINDQEGHLYGDRILQDLAKLFDEYVRETDIVARYGGEEFVVVMPQTDLEGACIFSERLRAKVQQEMSLTISGGVAMALDGDTRDSLLARADSALYDAKAAGRNRVYRHTGEHAEPVGALTNEPLTAP